MDHKHGCPASGKSYLWAVEPLRRLGLNRRRGLPVRKQIDAARRKYGCEIARHMAEAVVAVGSTEHIPQYQQDVDASFENQTIKLTGCPPPKKPTGTPKKEAKSRSEEAKTLEFPLHAMPGIWKSGSRVTEKLKEATS